jgi:hypothetical protein
MYTHQNLVTGCFQHRSTFSRKPRLTAVGIRCADHVAPSNRKSRHYFADSGGRSVVIVRLRTKATEFFSLVPSRI